MGSETELKPRIERLVERRLIGVSTTTCLRDNIASAQTLWRGFMPRLNHISGRVSTNLLSVQVFDEHFNPGDPTSLFEKWAAVEVMRDSVVPEGMQEFCQSGGLYAVFVHHGPAKTFSNTMQQIHALWLPTSGYQLDGREHFEVMPDDYRPDDLKAIEEIWVPIR